MPQTQKQWIKTLQDHGWPLERGAKHQVKMTKPGQRPVRLPENMATGLQQRIRGGVAPASRFVKARTD